MKLSDYFFPSAKVTIYIQRTRETEVGITEKSVYNI